MTTHYSLMVAPNGARLSRLDHSAVPVTAQQIADTAAACAREGASAIHVHVRDDQGMHSLDPGRYAKVIAKIKAQTSIAIQISTEAAGRFDVSTQRHCLEKAPATEASVSLREIAREPFSFAQTYAAADARGMEVQHILYDAGDLDQLFAGYDTCEIPANGRRAIFVLGRYANGQTSSPRDLNPFLKGLGGRSLNWSTCAFGRAEQDCLLAALDGGGDVRVGFENNCIAPDGSVFSDNAASVASLVESAAKAGFQPREVSP